MRIPFRQGIVRCLDAGFLTVGSSYVTLNVLDEPALIAVAHGSVDYLIVEQRTAASAWGPISPGVDQWLYWDINNTTAIRTFGITMVRPMFQANPPQLPANDQHWFDTTTGTMKVWNSTAKRWVERIRVFACELNDGTTPLSMSANSPDLKGTQVGIIQPCYAGTILKDVATGNPLRTSDGKFLTGETKLQAATGATSNLKTEALIIEAEAQQSMPAYTVVRFVDFGKIAAANQFTASSVQQFGIIETDAVIGDVVIVTTTGIISNPNWNWTSVNALLYSDPTGQLSMSPTGSSAPIGIVVDVNKILLFTTSATIGSSGGGGSTDPATTTALGVTKMSVVAADPLNPVAVGDNDPRIVNALSKTGGTMTGALTLSTSPTLANHAATKSYVDNQILFNGGSSAHTKTNNAGSALTIGTPVHSLTAGSVAKASAADPTTSDVMGLVTNLEVAIGQQATIQTSGTLTATTGQWDAVTGQVGGLTEGASYYISAFPAGRLTTSPPSTPGQYVTMVGIAISSTQLFINIAVPILL